MFDPTTKNVCLLSHKCVSFGFFLFIPQFSVPHECCGAFDSSVQVSHTLTTIQEFYFLNRWGGKIWFGYVPESSVFAQITSFT